LENRREEMRKKGKRSEIERDKEDTDIGEGLGRGTE
jgi:hypothetical protein